MLLYINSRVNNKAHIFNLIEIDYSEVWILLFSDLYWEYNKVLTSYIIKFLPLVIVISIFISLICWANALGN